MHMTIRSFFPSRGAASSAALALATLLAVSPSLTAQETTTPAQSTDPRVTGSTTTTTDAQGQKQQNSTITISTRGKKKSATHKVDKGDKVKQSKDTRKFIKRDIKDKNLVGKDASLPDKQLLDKALAQQKSGHYDIARLDLQTLLNTYPDSQYQMQAKLAVADCWYREGGSAALTQAEQEYNDFITFFPNAPEAAEAQMRIGDIYFKQMDVPDRDYTKAVHAEAAYRTMLKQYPDAPKKIIDEASQKLREVQEVLATREAEIAAFYGTHENWPAAIARYDTVIDTYPQYSHMDDALIGKGDAYEAEAATIRAQAVCDPKVQPTGPCLPEGAKVKILQYDDGIAADAYRKVVLLHAAAPHVEDAKERLASMNLPIPTPTAEEVAASEALEGSRAQYTMRRRLELLFMRKPDTVTAAGAGAPPLEDPAATTAPGVLKDLKEAFVAALNPNAPKPHVAAATSDGDAPAATDTPAPPASTAAPTFEDVPAAGAGSRSDTSAVSVAAPSSGAHSGASLGVEIVSPGASAPATVRAVPALGAPPSDLPAATGAPDPNYGLKAVAPKDNAALPAIEKPAAAPDTINEAQGHPQPPAQTAPTDANGKKKKVKAPAVDKNDESSSKQKKKKGLDKLNPF
ncbi:MAG: outer membrane protein assembly factor BamD [Acidobacteriota bacterium]